MADTVQPQNKRKNFVIIPLILFTIFFVLGAAHAGSHNGGGEDAGWMAIIEFSLLIPTCLFLWCIAGITCAFQAKAGRWFFWFATIASSFWTGMAVVGFVAPFFFH